MSAPLRHPVIPVAVARQETARRPWNAIIRPEGNRWVPVFVAGKPLVFNDKGLAHAVASGYRPGGMALWMGYSEVCPDEQAILEAANPGLLAPLQASDQLDLDLPDGLYEDLDILTAGRLNAERKRLDDAKFDNRGDRLLMALEGD